jgi:hypothetical protein
MNDIVEWIKLLGGLAGLAALAWRFIDEFGSYLRITVEAQVPKDGWVTVLTIVDNKGNRPKDLSYAFFSSGPKAKVLSKAQTLLLKRRVTTELSGIRMTSGNYALQVQSTRMAARLFRSVSSIPRTFASGTKPLRIELR